MLLADKFVEGARAHAIGKRAGAIVWIFSARDGLKEAHVSNLRFPIFELPSVVAVPGHLVGFSLHQRQRIGNPESLSLLRYFIQHNAGCDSCVQRFHFRGMRDDHYFVHL